MSPNPPTLRCRACARTVLPSTAARTDGRCLDCFYEEKRRAARAAEQSPGCRACDGSVKTAAFRFDWDRAIMGADATGKYPRYLRAAGPTRLGMRYACTICGAVWHLQGQPGHRWMTLIPTPYMPVFEAWCATPLPCPPPILAVARSIGATPPAPYDGGTDEARIPCRVLTRLGESIEPAVLRFSNAPPVPWADDIPARLPCFRPVADAAAIVPSRFALPPTVRLQVSSVLEARMGDASIVVATRQGRRFVLNGRPDFFDCDGIVGEELTPADAQEEAAPAAVETPSHPTTPTVFVADWFPGAENMYLSTAARDDRG